MFGHKCFRQLYNKSINLFEYLKQIGTKYYSDQLVWLTTKKHYIEINKIVNTNITLKKLDKCNLN